MTNFAVLTDVTGATSAISGTNAFVLSVVTYIGLGISVVCLLITALVYLYFKTIRTAAKHILIHLCITLAMAQLLFIFGVSENSYLLPCKIITVALHYFFISAFMWMLIEGLHLYYLFVIVFHNNEQNAVATLLAGYLVPAIIAGTTAGLRWDLYGNDGYCWLPLNLGTRWAFLGPMLLIILVGQSSPHNFEMHQSHSPERALHPFICCTHHHLTVIFIVPGRGLV